MKLNKIFALLFALFATTICSVAQPNVHIIKQGDNLSNIAKTNHTTVAELNKINGLKPTDVLRIGQKIQLPTAAKSAVVKPKVVVEAPAATGNTHVVAPKESLSKIARDYGMTVAQIKALNNLADDKIKIGQTLNVSGKAATQATPKPVIKKEEPTETNPIKTKPTADKTAPIETTKPITKPLDEPIEKPTTKPAETGYFASLYTKGNQSTIGIAGTFKTAAGWVDKKYYVLMNNVAIETIVKISMDNKTIYAKVLGPLPDIKEDDGLLLRMSTAAANALGANSNKFAVAVTY